MDLRAWITSVDRVSDSAPDLRARRRDLARDTQLTDSERGVVYSRITTYLDELNPEQEEAGASA